MFSIRSLNCARTVNWRVVNYTCVKCHRSTQKHQKVLDQGPAVSDEDKLFNLIQIHKDKIIYSDYINKKELKLGYQQNQGVIKKYERKRNEELAKFQNVQPLPISLKYLINNEENPQNAENSQPSETQEEEKRDFVQFPFSENEYKVESVVENPNETEEIENISTLIDIEVQQRLNATTTEHMQNWMTNYENYDDLQEDAQKLQFNYGTPNPKSKVSSTPCGGCGALLHCKDSTIPGYIPSEIYESYDKPGGTPLSSIICQRCFFLKNHNLALQVRVSPDDYPKILLRIAEKKKALVILIVDLLDFPCSIWPGIADLIGHNRPIVVVGNKVDLLPQDSPGFLGRVTKSLENAVKLSGFASSNIKHVSLVSAKTGFGIEDLITKLFSTWQYKGDVFIVGCTNVGKSSLFNALLQSDYCKAEASDLIQRATTSPWPGTTLNLLKFPILRPTGWRLYVRHKRLESAHKLMAEERRLRMSQLKVTGKANYAELIGYLDRSFSSNTEENSIKSKDPFSVNVYKKSSQTFGINEKDARYASNKWCYDTPGVVQPDQVTDLLTAEELVLTFPKRILRPKTFSLRPGLSILIGGLARLDFTDGSKSARFTVFCTDTLPITVCNTENANEVYDTFLGTDVLRVPKNIKGRLKLWPGLKSKNLTVQGEHNEKSRSDVVLSSIGWVSITCGPNEECQVTAWTPEARGIHLRESLLPYAVTLRGRKIRHSPAYTVNKFYVE